MKLNPNQSPFIKLAHINTYYDILIYPNRAYLRKFSAIKVVFEISHTRFYSDSFVSFYLIFNLTISRDKAFSTYHFSGEYSHIER